MAPVQTINGVFSVLFVTVVFNRQISCDQNVTT